MFRTRNKSTWWLKTSLKIWVKNSHQKQPWFYFQLFKIPKIMSTIKFWWKKKCSMHSNCFENIKTLKASKISKSHISWRTKTKSWNSTSYINGLQDTNMRRIFLRDFKLRLKLEKDLWNELSWGIFLPIRRRFQSCECLRKVL